MFSVVSQWIWGFVSPPVEPSQDPEIRLPRPEMTLGPRLDIYPEGNNRIDATGESAFFQRLPPDIRRMILIEAWGEDVVYVDLLYGSPSKDTPLFPDEDGISVSASWLGRSNYWTGETPLEFYVGAVGWLRSCRQA